MFHKIIFQVEIIPILFLFQRVCERKRTGGKSCRFFTSKGGTETGTRDEWLHELDLQGRYVNNTVKKELVLEFIELQQNTRQNVYLYKNEGKY